MSKDPAFLFYPGDWLGGTQLFNRAHKGAYMDLLMAQYANGPLHINDIAALLGSDFDSMWESKLKPKFKIDSNGLYFNEKLAKTMEDRKKFTASRIENLKGKKEKKSSHMATHMDTHTEVRMENVNGNRDSIRSGSEKRKGGAGEKQNTIAYRVIQRLNEVAGRNFRPETKAYHKGINARIMEGFTEADLFGIIENRTKAWKGTDMEQHLTPDTLFSTKAHKYRDMIGVVIPIAQSKDVQPEGGRYAHERKTIFDKA